MIQTEKLAAPPLIEVIAEIRFDREKESKVLTSYAGEFFLKIRDRYPSLQTRSDMTVQINVENDAKKIQHHASMAGHRFVFENPSTGRSVQLSDNSLSLHFTKDYPGWDDFASTLKEEWYNIESLVGDLDCKTVALRYINQIHNSEKGQKVGHWLSPSEFVPSAILNQSEFYFSNVRSVVEKILSIGIVIAPMAVDVIGDRKSIIFDLEAQRDVSKSKISGEELFCMFDEMHQNLFGIFDKSTTKTAKLTWNKVSSGPEDRR